MIEIKNILVPLDFSLCSDAAIQHALLLAEAVQAEVHLLHVIESREGFKKSTGYPDVEPPFADLLARARQRARAKASTKALSIRRVTLQGNEPTSEILNYIRANDIDLVVMGTHGRRSVERFLNDVEDHWIIGKTAEEVISLSRCPVLTVGPRGRMEPVLVADVIVPIDFSMHAARTVTYAAALAKIYQARLTVLHVLEGEPLNGNVSDVTNRMKVFYEKNVAMGYPAAFEVVVGNPAHLIPAFANSHRLPLIVMSSHGADNLLHERLGREADKIIRAAPCPVFTVKANGYSLLKRDRSPSAERAASDSGFFQVPGS